MKDPIKAIEERLQMLEQINNKVLKREFNIPRDIQWITQQWGANIESLKILEKDIQNLIALVKEYEEIMSDSKCRYCGGIDNDAIASIKSKIFGSSEG